MERQPPSGLELTPLSEPFREDPYSILDYLRRCDPVHRDRQLQRFVLTEQQQIRAVLRSQELLNDPRKSREGSFGRFFLKDDAEISMLFMDEPEHGRMRKLVNDIFTPKAVERWRPRVIEIVEQHLDRLQVDEFELISEFAGPVPTVVIAEMLGIESGDYALFKAWSEQLVKTSFNPQPSQEEVEATRLAENQLQAFLADQVEFRRRQPGRDLISDMVRARQADDQLTDDEIIMQCRLLLVAGNVTTTDLIGNGVKALLDHPEQLARLRQRPELIVNAVEEILRYDSPVMNTGRIAHADMELGGCPLEKGDYISVFLGAANYDPNVCESPHTFDISRQNIVHHSFGGGRHFCLGASLARLEGQEAIGRLFRRFPNLKLSSKGAVRAAVPGFRGFQSLWLSSRAGSGRVG